MVVLVTRRSVQFHKSKVETPIFWTPLASEGGEGAGGEGDEMLRNRSKKAAALARDARKNPSAAEAVIWQILRGGKLGFKFRREYPIGPYRLDFYCAEAKLALEMDGDQHDPERDQVRDKWMLDHGIVTLRIPNRRYFLLDEEPYQDVVTEIIRACRLRVGSEHE